MPRSTPQKQKQPSGQLGERFLEQAPDVLGEALFNFVCGQKDHNKSDDNNAFTQSTVAREGVRVVKKEGFLRLAFDKMQADGIKEKLEQNNINFRKSSEKTSNILWVDLKTYDDVRRLVAAFDFKMTVKENELATSDGARCAYVTPNKQDVAQAIALMFARKIQEVISPACQRFSSNPPEVEVIYSDTQKKHQVSFKNNTHVFVAKDLQNSVRFLYFDNVDQAKKAVLEYHVLTRQENRLFEKLKAALGKKGLTPKLQDDGTVVVGTGAPNDFQRDTSVEAFALDPNNLQLQKYVPDLNKPNANSAVVSQVPATSEAPGSPASTAPSAAGASGSPAEVSSPGNNHHRSSSAGSTEQVSRGQEISQTHGATTTLAAGAVTPDRRRSSSNSRREKPAQAAGQTSSSSSGPKRGQTPHQRSSSPLSSNPEVSSRPEPKVPAVGNQDSTTARINAMLKSIKGSQYNELGRFGARRFVPKHIKQLRAGLDVTKTSLGITAIEWGNASVEQQQAIVTFILAKVRHAVGVGGEKKQPSRRHDDVQALYKSLRVEAEAIQQSLPTPTR